MTPFPLQAGQLGFSRSAVVAAWWGAQVIQTSSTTVAPAIHANSQKGYLLVAIIMSRSAPASVPAGWTLASSAVESSGTYQRTDVYVRLSTGAGVDAPGATVTFTQTSAGRMIGQILSIFVGSDPAILEKEANSHSTGVPGSYAVPSLAARGWARFAVAIASFEGASITPTATTISATAGWTAISNATIDQNRLGIFYKFIGPDEVSACTITSSYSSSGNATGHMLHFSPAA